MDLPESKRTILIVEDNEINREMLCSLLEEDFNVLEAENGLVGVELLKKYCLNFLHKLQISYLYFDL